MCVKVFVNKIVKDLYILRIDDDEIVYFEGLWEIPEKITYNAYLLLSDDGCVLFDAWKARYLNELVEAINKVADIRDISHIVIHHMEPDHSGCVPGILSEADFKPEILAHPMSCQMLGTFYGVNAKVRPVHDGEEVNIAGRRLRFIYTSWLHWPETIFTHYLDGGVLFTGDVFGGYSMPLSIFDDDEKLIQEYLPHVRKYFATVIGTYRQHVLQAIQKLTNTDFGVIAPAHGLVWRKNPKRIIDYYSSLANGHPEEGKIAIIYCSMYGESLKAARFVAEELEKSGLKTVMHGFTDISRTNLSDLLSELIDSEAIIFSAPTYESDIHPTAHWIAELVSKKIPSNKSIIIMSSYGWSEVTGKKLSMQFKGAGFEVKDIITFKGRFEEKTAERVRESVNKILTSKSQ